MAAPACWTATWTAPNVTGCAPNAFVKRKRMARPPMLVWTMFRMVWLAKSFGRVNCDALPALAVQTTSALDALRRRILVRPNARALLE
jgi:hypothetical protein